MTTPDPATIAKMPVRPAKCRECSSEAYTTRELNVSPGQDWRCYRCFDRARGLTWSIPHADQ